jgi:hypothetical protein
MSEMRQMVFSKGVLALTVLRHFAKPVLWDSFKNLLGLAFKNENTNGKII